VGEEHIDEIKSIEDGQNSHLEYKIVDHDIIQLSNNYIPKGLVPLQKLFDHNNVSKNSLLNSQQENGEDYIIGTSQEIKNVKISASLSHEINDKISIFLNIIEMNFHHHMRN